jgi:hypothetical protein
VSLDLAFSLADEVDEKDVPVFDAGDSEEGVGVVVGEGDETVDFVLLEAEGLDHVFDLHGEEVHEEDLVVQRHCDLALPDAHLLDLRTEGDVRDDLLRL